MWGKNRQIQKYEDLLQLPIRKLSNKDQMTYTLRNMDHPMVFNNKQNLNRIASYERTRNAKHKTIQIKTNSLMYVNKQGTKNKYDVVNGCYFCVIWSFVDSHV